MPDEIAPDETINEANENNAGSASPPVNSDSISSPPGTDAVPPPITSNPAPTISGEPVASTPKKRSKARLIILLIVVVIAAAVVTAFSLKHTKTQPVSTKKDIPYLTYGLSDSGDITPSYPTETADTNNTGFIDAQLFEGLVSYQDQIKVVPSLATSWTNPNSTTWIFNLRHGVHFHSGRVMTAADVKYSLDYAIARQSDNGSATSLILASSIKQVDTVNPYQIKITTNGPDPVLLNRLALLYVLDSKATLGSPNAGTGPYVVKPGSVKPNAITLDLVAFNGYWGGHVYTRAVHFQEVPSFDQLASDTAKGKFDMAGDFDAQQLAEIKIKSQGYHPIKVPDLGVSYVELNLNKAVSPLHALAARQAVAYALNIPAILKAGGLSGTQASQVIPSVLPGYDPSIKNIPYDPAKAKKLLATVPNANTQLTLNYPTGDEGQIGEIVKELDAVGFNVKATAVQDLGALVNMAVAGQGDMFYLSYGSNTLDGLDIINNTVAGTQNYNSPELTTLINQASSTIDPAARIAVLQKLERLVATDVPTIALYTQTRTYSLTKPYVIKSDLPAIDTSNYFWQTYQK